MYRPCYIIIAQCVLSSGYDFMSTGQTSIFITLSLQCKLWIHFQSHVGVEAIYWLIRVSRDNNIITDFRSDLAWSGRYNPGPQCLICLSTCNAGSPFNPIINTNNWCGFGVIRYHDPTTTSPRPHHDPTTTSPRPHHNLTMTPSRPNHDLTTTPPQSHHDPTMTPSRPHNPLQSNWLYSAALRRAVLCNMVNVKMHALYSLSFPMGYTS